MLLALRRLCVLACGLLSAMLTAAQAQQAERTPWRLGAPEIVWRYRSLTWSHLGGLAVHPEGGVIAVAYGDRDGITLFRLSPSGTKLWERTLAVGAEMQHGHVHLTFLRRRGGVDTIVASYGGLTAIGPNGTVRWTRSAAQLGIANIGVAIAGPTRTGYRIVVGGEGDGDRGSPVMMAAGLTADGTRRWLAVGPWPAGISPAPEPEEDPPPDDADRLGQDRDIPTATLPLRILEDGGAVVLTGCGQIGVNVRTDRGPFTVRAPPAPCVSRATVALVAIDGGGRTTSTVVAGSAAWRAQAARWNLPPAVVADTWLEPYEIGQASSGGRDPREFPDFLPFAWWLAPSASLLLEFLDRSGLSMPLDLAIYQGAQPSQPPSPLAALPVADVVVAGAVTYVLLSPTREADIGYGLGPVDI